MSVFLFIHMNDLGDLSMIWFFKVWRFAGNKLPVTKIKCTVSANFLACLNTQKWTHAPPTHSFTIFRGFPVLWRILQNGRSSRVRSIRRIGSVTTRDFTRSEPGRESWLNCYSFFLSLSTPAPQAGLRWIPKQQWSEAPPLPAWSACSGYSLVWFAGVHSRPHAWVLPTTFSSEPAQNLAK